MAPIAISIVGTGLVLLGWYAIVAGYAWFTRPRDLEPGPATDQLGPEPPAVVNLLVTRCELTQDAADATLLDLAARHIVEFYQPGLDPAALLVKVRNPEPTGLNPYELRVFDRVKALAPEEFVPLTDITKQLADGGPAWFMQFRSEVIADAANRGLIRVRRFGSWAILISILAGMAVAGLAVLPFQREVGDSAENAIAAASVPGWFCATVFIAFALILVAVSLLRTPTQTPAGRTIGSGWLGLAAFLSEHRSLADLPPAAVAVWDRYLSYGVALGVNPVASKAIDLRVSRRVQLRSYYTGTPRLVVVRYPRGRFAYTQAGVRLLWSIGTLMFWGATGWVLLRTGRAWPFPIRATIVVLLSVMVLRGFWVLLHSLYVKLVPLTVTGQILARHPFRVGAPGTFGWFELVIDDGRHDTTRPWLIRADKLGAVSIGDTVRVRGQRWTHHALEVTVVSTGPVLTSTP
jgi:hypothetical protein